MFRTIDKNTPEVEITLDQETLRVPAGISLAAVLLLKGRIPSRINPVDRSPRAPHCLTGSCFECLVEVDGVELRACQVMVQQGMQVRLRLDDQTS